MIDLRIIKCSCGIKECISGISFDSDEKNGKNIMIFRFHDRFDKEHVIELDNKTKKQLIKELKTR